MIDRFGFAFETEVQCFVTFVNVIKLPIKKQINENNSIKEACMLVYPCVSRINPENVRFTMMFSRLTSNYKKNQFLIVDDSKKS